MSERQGPRPSIWPVALALGVSLACAGVITHPVILGGGALLTVVALGGWVVDTVRGD